MEQTNHINQQLNQFSPKLYAAYFAQFVLYLLIIIYSILSPSLFSSISIFFMMVAISVNITRIYTVDNKSETQRIIKTQDIQVKPYRLQRIIWILFAAFNFVVFIFKIIIMAKNIQNNYTTDEQSFYQIQDYLHMFLPILLFPFSICSTFINPRPKLLSQFRKQISEKIRIPTYFLLGALCIVIQIWSQSIIGLVYFFISLTIYCIKNTSFINVVYRFIVRLIQLITIIVIPLSLLVSTKLFQSYSNNKYYATVGLDGIYNFNSDIQPAAHFITQIILFLYSCVLSRLFEYQKINIIAIQKIDQYSISVRQIIGDHMQANQTFDNSPTKTLRQSLLMKREELQQNEKLAGHEEHDSDRKISLFQPQVGRTWSHNLQKRNTQNHRQKRTTQSLSHSSKSKKKEELQKAEKKRIILQKIWDKFLKTINQIISFLNSSDFTLRVAQVISIIIIQRYNNVYSFIVLVWLAMIASIQNLKAVYLITMIVLLPLEIINYIIMFLYNAPNSPFQGIQHKSIWGFQIMYAYWLDVLLFNIFMYYLILFVSAASKQTRSSLYSKSKKISEPSNFVLIMAFLFRYTYLLAIAGMFFLGFSNITCIDLGYIVLFFLFFTFGQNLAIQTKLKKKKSLDGNGIKTQKVYVLTTLSRKFWFVIVYYTLIVIVSKYVYFLFFQNKATQILDPVGINEIYNWAFNFSLTSVCKSNTTPFFIIFVLAQLQIIIHRSNIYLNYSFSLIASSNDRKLKGDKDKKVSSNSEKLKNISQKIICFCLEFYYQGLYYFAGVIILACSSTWNIVQVPLVILTCIGLLNKFNKKLLVSIVFIDLLFIFGTYIFRFLNYEAIFKLFGPDLTDNLKKIALFCGFNLNQNESLYEIIAFNVVIVYFSVEAYRLCNKLNENMQSNESIRDQVFHHDSSMHQKQQKQELPQSQYEPTVIDSQFEDKQFAVHYQQGVVQATKIYYHTDMAKKYIWLKYMCKFFSFIIVDAVSIVVLVCCLYFRLCVSMFAFLILYLIFYYFLFARIGRYLNQVNYMGRIELYLDCYNQQQANLQQKQNPVKIQNNRQKINQLKQFTHNAYCEILNLKYSWKKSLWIYSAVFSVVCLILTYIAQFLVSDFFVQYVHWESIDEVQDILFILGFSVNNKTSFFRQVYFYYVMIIVNVIEKLLINFFQKDKEQQSLRVDVKKQFKEIIKIDNPSFLINSPQATKQFIIEEETFQKLCHIDEQNQQNEASEQYDNFQIDAVAYQKEIVSASNLLIYFNYKQAQVKINIIYALLATMVRVYLWLMLINVYQRSSFSAFLYLFTLFYFWFRKIEFTVVKDINKAAIIIFLIQYLMLLLDIEQNTSPLPLPNDRNLSLLQKYVTDPEWLKFLVIGQDESKTSFILISFFINSIIIFVTQLYFSGFQYISRLCLKLTEQIWDRYQYIFQTISKTDINQTLDLNFESYKSWRYRMLEFSYENFIVNSYVIVSIFVLLLLSADHTYISLTLLTIVFVYIFMARYTEYGNQGKIYWYTKLFFQCFRIILFLLITLSVIFGIPLIQQYIDAIPDSIGLDITLSEIFLILFIQLWLDCTYSKQFQRITNSGLKKTHKKQMVRLQCLAYQSNNKFMSSLIKTFKQIMTFQMNIKQAHQIIKQWENTFKVEQLQVKNIHEIQTGAIQVQEIDMQGQISPALKALRDQIKNEQKKNDQQSQQKPYFDQLGQFLQKNTNSSLSFSYFELMKYVVKNNKKILQKILNKQKINIDIWDYILEDYTKLEQQIRKCKQKLNQIGQRIIQEDDDFSMQYLQIIIQDEYSLQNINGINPTILTINQQLSSQANLYKVVTPKKINLVMNHKQQRKSFSKKLWFWILSNFNYFVIFMIFIYYTINPCLLSLPLIVYIFSYYVIADKKYNNVIIIYLCIVIIIAELFQLQFFDTSQITEFFFYLPDQDTYHFAIGFLFLLFILVLIDEQIKKYQGINHLHQSEAQSFESACLRILINQKQNSDIYLWKMYFQDQEEYEKNNNPVFYAEDMISSNPQNLTTKPKYSFFDIFYRNKPGIDLYPYIATVQIFLTIYLIFFYPLMTLLNQGALSESFKYFTFSSNMIIGVLSHVFIIVAQRRITLLSSQNPHKELIKYIFTMIVFIMFLIFIFYWASETPPMEYQPQSALIAFSFFYFIYFFLSGIQVKYGYKKFKKINSFMVKRDMFGYIFVLVFIAIPFLYEIKCIMDWTFLKTSLQLFDWFKLFSIYVSSFKAKIQQIGTLQTKLGESVEWSGKIIGWIGFILLLLIIFGPMILFSGLNPSAQPNLVNGGSFQLGIHVIGGNQFTLYSTSHFSNPPLFLTEQQFNQLGFRDVPELKSLTANDLTRQFQNISFETYADSFWAISPPNYNFLKMAFNKSTYEMKNNLTQTNQYRMTIDYILNRQVAQTTASITTFQFPGNNGSISFDIVSQLNHTFHTCNSSTTIPGLYNSLIRLVTSGATYKPSPIFYQQDDGTQRYLQNVKLKMTCVNEDAEKTLNTNNIYWEVTIQGTSSGIQMFVYADLYQSLLGGLSFTAIYTSIILVVAGFIRGFLAGNLPLIPYEMNAKPEKILQICQAIGIHRQRKQFKEEFLMYYELIDVIRSPQIIRKLGASYTNLIAKNSRLKRYKELTKQQKQKKKNI